MTTTSRSALKALAVVATCLSLTIGASWLGSAGGVVIGGVPLLILCAGVSMLVQWLVFVPAAITQSERFFDLTGSLTYLTLMAFSLAAAGTQRELTARQILLSAAVVIWALRLGTFLFLRIRKDGRDGRFDEIKIDPMRFWGVWTIQGLWVFFTALCVLIVNTRATSGGPLGLLDGIGMALWALGMGIEVLADRQKSAFKSRPENEGRWIDEGLWSRAQHPNYFGEILLWSGLAVVGAGVMEGGQWIGLFSPVFVATLLLRVSGVPLLRERSMRRWGDNPEYLAYLARTRLLLPVKK
jgi:steroid 5-alpha reductase family enzyme